MRAISFRKLMTKDFPLLVRWLNYEHVREWWGSDRWTIERVTEEYGPVVAGTEPTRSFLIVCDNVPIGYIQTYLCRDYPEYANRVAVGEKAAGLDLFIGEPDFVHRGLGSQIIGAFLKTILFADGEVDSCVIGPAMTNTSAIRAYEKAGFTYLKTVHIPGEPVPEYVMIHPRPSASG